MLNKSSVLATYVVYVFVSGVYSPAASILQILPKRTHVLYVIVTHFKHS